jgi:cytochrome c-type biogenesis protein CcsB
MRALFYLALTAYFIGSAASLVYFAHRSHTVGRIYLGAVIVGFVAHTLLLGLFWAISGHFPTATHAGSMVFFSWLIIVLLAALEARYRLPVVGSFVVPIAFVPMLYASFLDRGPSQAPEILKSGWFLAHTSLAFLANAAFVIAFAVGWMYLLQVKSRHPGANFWRLPPLATLDEINRWSIAIGFPLLTMGILTGAIWAEVVSGKLPFDPKVAWSLGTWLIYGLILNMRQAFGWRGQKAAILSIAGFALVMFTYVIVNIFFTTFHSFELFQTLESGA